MNSTDNILELFQKSFRVTVGATSALVESLQDTQKREENLSKLQTDWSQFAEELAEKGATTEQEARKFVDSLLTQPGGTSGFGQETASGPIVETVGDPIPTTAVPIQDSTVQSQLRELITQIAEMREELAKLHNPG